MKHKSICRIVLIFLIACQHSFFIYSQTLPDDRVLAINNLVDYLKEDVKKQLVSQGEISSEALAKYFRQKFSERFFYDYRTVDKRLTKYNNVYHNSNGHRKRALDHMGKYSDSTRWVLPFNYLNGEPVNAYALRHLARQHKMVDIIFHYFNDERDPKYIKYFENQMQSLNQALVNGEYESIEDGNGVYEVFRAGYRIMNWLWIHNLLLNEQEYSDEDQLYTIATLLQHGSHLYNRNAKFRSGNHQTKGMSALAMLSILLRDFVNTDLWYNRSTERLKEHMLKEINEDGFQFERSVHYHMSDINNYFYVYQLVKINDLVIDQVWEDKLRSLFTTLVMIAYPDKTAPVLQDDTEIPWGEKNEIAGVMTLGYLLFEDPQFGYFAANEVAERLYWFLSKKQLELLDNIKVKKPKYGSLNFDKTHYYIMREGWNKNDKVMVISAGLDSLKPDHQHGDMLGIQAIANGHAILPNYQVRYSLEDFELFKNSMVKNVALVDDQLQGKQWTSNKGGSGFGKFKELPNPSAITWKSNDAFDLFIGTHDGFENDGVEYSRQVIYLKDDLWIVKDNFQSDKKHLYKQIWQGHYTVEGSPNLIRSTSSDASGCDILQLIPIDDVQTGGARGKQWSIATKESLGDFNFVTIVYPYRGYSNRIDETSNDISIDRWKLNKPEWTLSGDNPISLTRESESYFFNVDKINSGNINIQFSKITDLYVNINSNSLELFMLGDSACSITISSVEQELNKGLNLENKIQLLPGDSITLKLK